MKVSRRSDRALALMLAWSMTTSSVIWSSVEVARAATTQQQIQRLYALKKKEITFRKKLAKGEKVQSQIDALVAEQEQISFQMMDQPPRVLKTTNENVIPYALKLVRKYDIAEQQLEQIAKQKGVPLSSEEIQQVYQGKPLDSGKQKQAESLLEELAFQKKQAAREHKTKQGQPTFVIRKKSEDGSQTTVKGSLSELTQYLKKDDGSDRIQVNVNQDGLAPFTLKDLAENLVDNPESMMTTLEQMEPLRQSRLAYTPWSDTYWPIYQGILGARYADAEFLNQSNDSKKGEWKKFYDYVLRSDRTAASYIRMGRVNELSPAEKYAKLVGLDMGSMDPFTASMWAEGKAFHDSNKGDVETWMGICHGWAPASYMLPRPYSAIDVVGVDGDPITFYPSDIKALGSYAFANNTPNTRFIGQRCGAKEKDIKNKDRATGRILDEDCFDTNPGTWHMAVVNQIGVNRRSFVLDATYDYEVWNHPVIGYRYSYFNPITGADVSSMAQARVALPSAGDRFARFRGRDSKSIIGIKMSMEYGVETEPTQRRSDSAELDGTTTVEYVYDLELDGEGNILGGEWYSNKHPDFLWTPDEPSPTSGRALLGGEMSRLIEGSWARGARIPSGMAQFAAGQAANGEVAGTLVEALFAFANNADYDKDQGVYRLLRFGRTSDQPAPGTRPAPPPARPPVVQPNPVTPPRPAPPTPPVVVNPPARNDWQEVIVQVKERSGGQRDYNLARGEGPRLRQDVAAAAGAEAVSAACDVGINKVALSIRVPRDLSFAIIKSRLESARFEGVVVPRTDDNNGKNCFCEGSRTAGDVGGPLRGARCD